MNPETERIVCVGDAHTVTALRIAGIEGIAANPDTVLQILEQLREDKTCAVILLTRELTANHVNLIRDMNRESIGPALLEIPGIHTRGGSLTSVMTYINQALGIAL